MATTEELVSEVELKRLTGDFDIASILYLDLSDRGLTSQNLGALTLCSSLCVLHLPLNALTSTAPLQTLTQLQELDLSANRISSLEGCDKLVALRKLCLAGNLIHHLETLMVLAGLTQLKDLSLKLPGSELNNPVCSSAGYDVYVEQSFPSLVWLDGEKIAGPGAELYSLDRQPHEKEESGRREGGEVERAMPDHLEDPLNLAQFSDDEADTDIVTKLLAECSETSQRLQQHITTLRKELDRTS